MRSDAHRAALDAAAIKMPFGAAAGSKRAGSDIVALALRLCTL